MMLAYLANELGGTLYGDNVEVSSFSTDTRQLEKGQMFVALQGETFDGNRFVEEARRLGAVSALVNESFDVSLVDIDDFPILQVSDSLSAFGKIAALHARKMPAKKIAITGSCGKTTVKQMLSAVLSEKGKLTFTKGNLNNSIGVPMTLLSINKDDEFAVIEMGANHAGEIGYLSALVNPDVVTILNADKAHLEGFGSVDGVAKAKGEIFSGAKSGQACAVLSRDEKYFEFWKSLVEQNKLELMSCSTEQDDADVIVSNVLLGELDSKFSVAYKGDSFDVFLPFPGRYNIKNAMIVITIALRLGLTGELIARGLEKAKNEYGRMQISRLGEHATLIDDSYNANPLSLRSAIDVLSGFHKTTVLILGDMAELGEDSIVLHKEIGEYSKNQGVDFLFSCGELSRHAADAFGEGAFVSESQQELLEYLKDFFKTHQDAVYLVKGSRSAEMNRVVEAFKSMGVAE